MLARPHRVPYKTIHTASRTRDNLSPAHQCSRTWPSEALFILHCPSPFVVSTCLPISHNEEHFLSVPQSIWHTSPLGTVTVQEMKLSDLGTVTEAFTHPLSSGRNEQGSFEFLVPSTRGPRSVVIGPQRFTSFTDLGQVDASHSEQLAGVLTRQSFTLPHRLTIFLLTQSFSNSQVIQHRTRFRTSNFPEPSAHEMGTLQGIKPFKPGYHLSGCQVLNPTSADPSCFIGKKEIFHNHDVKVSTILSKLTSVCGSK